MKNIFFGAYLVEEERFLEPRPSTHNDFFRTFYTTSPIKLEALVCIATKPVDVDCDG